MLDLGLVVNLRVLGRFEKRRIEDLFLDGRVCPQGLTDLRRELLLARSSERVRSKLAEQPFDLAMIGFQQTDRVVASAAVLATVELRRRVVGERRPFFALRDFAMDCPLSVGRLSAPQLHVSCHEHARDRRGSAEIDAVACSATFWSWLQLLRLRRRGTQRTTRRARGCRRRSRAAQNLLRSASNHVVVESTWIGQRTGAAEHSSSKSVRPSTAAVRRSNACSAKPIDVEADVIVEGHERIACVLLHAPVRRLELDQPCR